MTSSVFDESRHCGDAVHGQGAWPPDVQVVGIVLGRSAPTAGAIMGDGPRLRCVGCSVVRVGL